MRWALSAAAVVSGSDLVCGAGLMISSSTSMELADEWLPDREWLELSCGNVVVLVLDRHH